jgi:hypothetical protein
VSNSLASFLSKKSWLGILGLLQQNLGHSGSARLLRLTHAVDPKRLAKELGFVLACFRELMTLFLDFVEQPHILDRDQRLVSEKGPAR